MTLRMQVDSCHNFLKTLQYLSISFSINLSIYIMQFNINFCFIQYKKIWYLYARFQVSLLAKNLPANAGDVRDMGRSLSWEDPPGKGHGNPLKYSCLENPVDREAWKATGHTVAQSRTQLKWLAHKALGDLTHNYCWLFSPISPVHAYTAPVTFRSRALVHLQEFLFHSYPYDSLSHLV